MTDPDHPNDAAQSEPSRDRSEELSTAAEIARLIQHGDPADPATAERLAELLGNTDPVAGGPDDGVGCGKVFGSRPGR